MPLGARRLHSLGRLAALGWALIALPSIAVAQPEARPPDGGLDGGSLEGGVPDGSVGPTVEPEPEPVERRSLEIAVAGSPPFVTQGDDDTIEGLSIDVWRAVAEEIGVDFELTRLDNAGQAVDAIRAGRYDAAIGPISITSDRARHVSFTQPYQQASLALLTRPGAGSLWSRIRPFVSRTFFSGVAILLVVLTLVGALVWLVERKENEGVPDHPLHGIGVGIWLALVTMTTVGYGDKAPVTLGGRVLVGVWMLIAMLSVSSLTAGIATALTLSSLDHAAIESAEELRGRPVAVIGGTTAEGFANEHGARVMAVTDLEEAVDLLRSDRADAVVYDKPVLQYWLREHPDVELVLSIQEYEPQGYGFAVPLDDGALRREIDVALLEMEEGGRLDEIRARWL